MSCLVRSNSPSTPHRYELEKRLSSHCTLTQLSPTGPTISPTLPAPPSCHGKWLNQITIHLNRANTPHRQDDNTPTWVNTFASISESYRMTQRTIWERNKRTWSSHFQLGPRTTLVPGSASSIVNPAVVEVRLCSELHHNYRDIKKSSPSDDDHKKLHLFEMMHKQAVTPNTFLKEFLPRIQWITVRLCEVDRDNQFHVQPLSNVVHECRWPAKKKKKVLRLGPKLIACHKLR